MGKTRKVKVGDYVDYAGKEWVITKKNKKYFRLVRRQVKTGPSVLVPRKRVRLADQTWRSNLQRGDALQLFLGGQWINATVYERQGSQLLVQPSLSNFTMQVSQDTGIIYKGSHSYPLWQRDDVTPVVVDGECRIERAHGLTFPWTYVSEDATRVEVTGPCRTPITTLTFSLYETRGMSFKLYKRLTKEEIMHDIYSNKNDHPAILVDIATQWCYSRLPIYPYLRHHYGLRYYITQALAHGDERRVQELLSVGEHSSIFQKSEWTIRDHLSHPYIDADIRVINKTLEVKLFHSGIKIDKTGETVKSILEHISQPMIYAPKKIEVDGTPEMQYILSRMLAMEKTPVELLSSRKITGTKIVFNLDRGFCDPEMNICGGQLEIQCIHYPFLVKELMKRSPMRTLVVVETNALPIWKGFNIFYGKNRKFAPITVTTKHMFSKIVRNERHFDYTERLIILTDTSWYSTFANVARNFRCKVKWALSNPDDHRNSCVFHSPHENNNMTIKLSRTDMEEMGVEFPQVTCQEVIFNVDQESVNIFIKRLRKKYPHLLGWRKDYCLEQLSMFLEHPELVPLEFRGERLAAVEATLSKISNEFGVSESILDTRTQETCAVCLEKISNASVTQCGHVFCTTCMQELHKRQINCPMCRSKITSFLKLSNKDTKGKIQVHEGVPYRISDNEIWGKKIDFLKKHDDATIVIPGKNGWSPGGLKDLGKSLKRKLKKVFRKRQILTWEELMQNQHPVSSKVIIMKPSNLQTNIGLPWGKDIEVLELKYKVKNTPFGREFF